MLHEIASQEYFNDSDKEYCYRCLDNGIELIGSFYFTYYNWQERYINISKYHENMKTGKIYKVGEFYVEYTDHITKYNIFIHSNETLTHPHFHVVDSNPNGKDVCLSLYDSVYYDHGGECVERLSGLEAECLTDFLAKEIHNGIMQNYLSYIWCIANNASKDDFRIQRMEIPWNYYHSNSLGPVDTPVRLIKEESNE